MNRLLTLSKSKNICSNGECNVVTVTSKLALVESAMPPCLSGRRRREQGGIQHLHRSLSPHFYRITTASVQRGHPMLAHGASGVCDSTISLRQMCGPSIESIEEVLSLADARGDCAPCARHRLS